MRLSIALCILTVLALPASASLAASANATGNVVPGLTGYWKLKDKGAAKPVLTDWAKTEMAKVAHKDDIDTEQDRWCVFQGMPYVMDNAGPIAILQAPDETVIAAERIATVRHIYFHLKRPSPDVFDFTAVGNSIGRRVGDVLVSDTQMFNNGVGPDGAPRTEKAHLVERFRVLDGGKELAVTSTWTDPKVFAKPYIYTWTYERLPDGYTAEPYYCDPRNNGVGNYPPGADPRVNAAGTK